MEHAEDAEADDGDLWEQYQAYQHLEADIAEHIANGAETEPKTEAPNTPDIQGDGRTADQQQRIAENREKG